MNKVFQRLTALVLALVLTLTLGACAADTPKATDAATTPATQPSVSSSTENTTAPATEPEAAAPEISGLTFQEETELLYAQCFHLYRYEGGYTLIRIVDGGDFLVVPEGAAVPDDLDGSITVLQQPLNRIYLAATSAMALFSAMDAVDAIRMTGVQASGWYIDAAIEGLNNGSILFAGKYSAPDYEIPARRPV